MARDPIAMLIIEIVSRRAKPEVWLIDDDSMDAIRIIRHIMKGDREVTRVMRDDVVKAINELIDDAKPLTSTDMQVISDALDLASKHREAEDKAKAEAKANETEDEAEDT
ncbi:MAG TPA: hypothetical protein VGN34_02835 [Ktedonobacteraceae bacterium]|jgi:hypothetical protein